MANANTNEGKWLIEFSPTEAGTKIITLNQENHFIDKNVDIEITTDAGALIASSGAGMEASSDVGIIGAATASEPLTGHYIKLEGQASVEVSTAGWLDEGTTQEASIPDIYYPVIEAAFTVDGPSVKTTAEGYIANNTTVGTVANGVQTITGAALSEGAKSVQINSDGAYDGSSYDSSDKIKFESAEAAGVYKIHPSGSATVNRAVVEKQVTSAGYFFADNTAQTAIAADSITVNTPETAYYIKKSTLSTSTVTSSNVQQTITVYEGYAPSDRTITIEAMAPATVTPTTANTGMSKYFNAGTSAENDVSLTPQYTVSSAGYVAAQTDTAGTVAYYSIKEQTVTETTTSVSGTTATRGTRTESAGWKETAETLTIATFTNTATSGQSYVDISGTTSAPVLVAGDYLYINKGWTDNLKISLAKLVPDGSDVKGHSEYILTGHSAYDDDGTLVAGSMPVWDGSYTIA